MAQGQYSTADIAAPPQAKGKYTAADISPAASQDQPGYLSQVGTGLWNTVKGLYSAGSEAGGVMADPMHAVEHLKKLKQMVLDPQIDQAIKAGEKWKSGDRSEAVGHALAAVLPGVGPAAANIGEKLGDRDFKGAAADATVLGATMAAPHVVPRVVGAAADALSDIPVSRVLDAAKEGTKAAVLNAPVIGPPIRAGMKAAADAWNNSRVTPEALRAGIEQAKLSQIQESAPPRVPLYEQAAPTPNAPVQFTPQQTPGPVSSRWQRAQQVTQGPAPEPPQSTPQPSPPQAPAPRAQVLEMPAPPAVNLDELAKSLAGKKFDNLRPEQKVQVRNVAADIEARGTTTPRNGGPPAGPVAVPPAAAPPAAPVAAPPAAAPSAPPAAMSLQEQLLREMESNGHVNQPPPADVPPTPTPQAQLDAGMREMPKQIRRTMADANYRAQAETGSGVPGNQAYEAAARANKFDAFTSTFREHGLNASDVKATLGENPSGGWAKLARSLGVNSPSKTTINQILQALETK